EGTGATGAWVWLRLGDQLVLAAAWPSAPGDQRRVALALASDGLPPLPLADHAVAVRHADEVIGALAVSEAPGAPLSLVELRLLEDIAFQAGLVVRNVRLTAQLAASLEELSVRAAELQASRQRIVAAQDLERRRVERDIHDGAQQHLVALMVQLGVARTLLDRDSSRVTSVLHGARELADGALRTLDDLATGIHPQMLAA